MNKELDEIRSIVAIHFGALGFLNPSENEQILKDRDKVLNYLNGFETVNNANPTEALKCLEEIKDFTCPIDRNECVENYFDNYFTIKQSLIKAQENEKENAKYKKAFELIKEKGVDISIIMSTKTVEEYNGFIQYCNSNLSEAEYNSLKEMFR